MWWNMRDDEVSLQLLRHYIDCDAGWVSQQRAVGAGHVAHWPGRSEVGQMEVSLRHFFVEMW